MKYILDKILYSSANVKRKWIVAIDREKYIHFLSLPLQNLMTTAVYF